MRRIKLDDPLTATEFLSQNPPQHEAGFVLPYFAPKGLEVFRCHNDLYRTYSDLKTTCGRRTKPGKGCLCLTLAPPDSAAPAAVEQKTLELA